MRKIDDNGLKICDFQGKIFELSINEFEGSSSVFIRRFMNSSLARRMDNSNFIFESNNIKETFNILDSEFGNKYYGKEKYKKEELYWIGYIYRYWAYTYEAETKQIYKIIKPGELRLLYFPYHSLDPKIAIERILESKNLVNVNMLEKGVQILREIRNNKKQIYNN